MGVGPTLPYRFSISPSMYHLRATHLPVSPFRDRHLSKLEEEQGLRLSAIYQENS